MNPAFLLVPGAFSNSFGWAPLQRELALRGLRSLAVDLPGRGYGACIPVAYQAPQDPAALASAPTGLAGTSLAANVEHVIGLVRPRRRARSDKLTPDNPFGVHSIASSHAGLLTRPQPGPPRPDRRDSGEPGRGVRTQAESSSLRSRSTCPVALTL